MGLKFCNYLLLSQGCGFNNILKLKQVQILSLRTTITIILFTLFLFLVFHYGLELTINTVNLFIFFFLLSIFIFFVIKKNVERYSSKKIQKLFAQSSLFKNVNFDNENLKSDFDSFFNTVSDVIDKKHEEIEKLLSKLQIRVLIKQKLRTQSQ